MGRVIEHEDGTFSEEGAPQKTGRARGVTGGLRGWLAWGRRSRRNKVLFVISIGVAAFVTAAFGWGIFNAEPEGDATLHTVFYWIWGLCAVDILFGMAEWKTSPLRKNAERGHLFVLLYIGALLIVTRALNSVLFGGYL